MNTLIFKTEDAIFQFDRESVIERLEHRKTLYEIKELDNLIQVLSSPPDQTVLSSAEHQYFGFIALDLINSNEGSVVCKICNKHYDARLLKAFSKAPDDASIKVYTGKEGKFKNLFRKKPKLPGMYGGKGYRCPEGHELIYLVTWVT